MARTGANAGLGARVSNPLNYPFSVMSPQLQYYCSPEGLPVKFDVPTILALIVLWIIDFVT
jgi:hypothetical protein